jgi:isopentenyl phosphate kinase
LMQGSEIDRNDVSGGMGQKVETALKISNYCHRCLIGSGYTPHLIRDFYSKDTYTGTIVRSIA